MKRVLSAVLFVSLVGVTSARQAPDLSGTWVPTTDVPATLPAAPSPILGPKISIAQTGKTLTVLRPVRDLVMSATYEIGGPESKTSVPGAACFGDSLIFETAAIDGDAIVITTTGTLTPGATARANANARRLLRRLSPDTMLVEGFTSAGGQARQVGTIYRKSSEVMTATPRAAAPIAASISNVHWLSGFWSTAGVGTPPPATTTEERWTPPAGGVLLGMARGVRGTTMSSFEFLCIAERAGGLVYTALPNARTPPTDFMMTSFTETSATFENPTHDFPKKIRYSLTPEGLLQTEISGATGSRVTTVTLKKQ